MKFNDYLQRAELVSLQNFIKRGGETFIKSSEESYSQRIDEANRKARNFFNKKFADVAEYDEISGYFDEQISVYEDVFFEIGLIIGAKIGFQLRGKVEELL